MSSPDESSSGLLEQAMVVFFPQQDPKVCQVSFRVGVPMLFFQTASVESSQMRLGERKSLDLRKAGSAVADEEKVSILSKARAGQPPHLIVDLHIDDPGELRMWAKALQSVLQSPEETRGGEDAGDRQSPTGSQKQPSALPSARSQASSEVEEECLLLRAKSQKLQQRISGLEAISERREKQMRKILKRLDGAMQMLDALQDMCGQQRKVISAQQVAILSLKEEGAVDEAEGDEEDEEEEEEAEEEEDKASDAAPRGRAFDPEAPGGEQQIMALLKQADQMERALRQIEAMESAGLLDDRLLEAGGAAEDEGGSVEEILGRFNTLEQEKAKFEEMVRQAQNGRPPR